MGLIKPDTKQTEPEKILNGVTIVKIASGSDHLSCLSNEGVVYTCGNGEAGQLGRISEHSSANGGRKGMSMFHVSLHSVMASFLLLLLFLFIRFLVVSCSGKSRIDFLQHTVACGMFLNCFNTE